MTFKRINTIFYIGSVFSVIMIILGILTIIYVQPDKETIYVSMVSIFAFAPVPMWLMKVVFFNKK